MLRNKVVIKMIKNYVKVKPKLLDKCVESFKEFDAWIDIFQGWYKLSFFKTTFLLYSWKQAIQFSSKMTDMEVR